MFIIVIDNVYIRHECDNKIFDKFSLLFNWYFFHKFPNQTGESLKYAGPDVCMLISKWTFSSKLNITAVSKNFIDQG